MPWKHNNGGEVYQPSIYAKEELPTWAEVYEDFYLNKSFFYDPKDEDHQKLDLYWKVPRLKYLLAVVCNQFNKMLFEDGMKDKILKSCYVDNDLKNPVDIRFVCEIYDKDNSEINWQQLFTNKDTSGPIPPPIYTIPLPTGETNPFITSDTERININDIKTPMSIYPIITYNTDGENTCIYAPMYINESQRSIYMEVLDLMMKPFKDYFEGSGIGWKDDEGNVIESSPEKRSCNTSGFDPAL